MSILGVVEQLSDRIYKLLLQRILGGELMSGDPVPVGKLAEEFGTSITPVRAAFERLTQDGLLVHVPFQGWHVRVYARQDVIELFEVRAALESFAADLCAQRVESSMMDALWNCHAKTQTALGEDGTGSYGEYNDELHDLVVRSSGNRTLVRMRDGVRNQIRLLVGHSIRVAGRPQLGIREHEAILTAIQRGNASSAGQRMREHILSAMEEVLKGYEDVSVAGQRVASRV